ncbi:MAG TPA: VIT and VWA domain-containing protein [Planctomycetota bacterium]
MACGLPALAGGTLKARGSPDQAIQIRDHAVTVSIVDGFARTEVAQTFYNPNDRDLEAIYAFPVPESASLSEMTILAGERELHGEVVRAEEAERVYAEEKDSGQDAGLAKRDAYRTFEFRLARVPAQGEARFRFVYYQPLALDAGVGRYVYPLEDGGTDDVARRFWEREETVQRSFEFHLELASAWPVEELRLPGLEASAVLQRLDVGRWQADVLAGGGHTLTRDVVVYYRLQDDLPGRVELVPYRASVEAPGTFQLVLTPGIDLAPLARGADHVFVLDVSGSMEGKLHTLAGGVARALGELRPEDRFRVVSFSEEAREVVPWTAATPEEVARALSALEGLRSEGSTNLYAGLALGMKELDDDRATSLVLVTDAVANTGETDPRRFAALMRTHDLRVFGFLLGNSANWPLMRTIADASGGFYAAVSNADDILGQILLAKQKVTHEALHDAQLSFSGVKVHDVSALRSKVYHGQQLVLFGRYAEPGPLEITLRARLTGEDRTYRATAILPPLDTEHPELERLWALDRIEHIEAARDLGELSASESADAIAHLGVAYQLVTDETAMLVLDDEAFERHGVERRNRERTEREHRAQAARAAAPRPSARVDAGAPAFPERAHTTRSGGGALDLGGLLLALLGAAAAWRAGRRVLGTARDSA